MSAFFYRLFLVSFFSFFQNSLLANTTLSSFGLENCKFCSKSIQSLQLSIFKKHASLSPILAWNNYDKTQLGLAFYSTKNLKKIDFLLLPMYGIGSKNLTGLGHFSYTFFTEKIQSYKLGVRAKRFSYALFPEDLAYNKLEPFFELDLNPSQKEKRKNHQQSITFRSSLIFIEFLSSRRNTSFYYVNDLKYLYQTNREENNIWFEIEAKQSSSFASLSGKLNLDFNYDTKKPNALHLSLFSGLYLFSNFNGNAPIAKFLLSGSTNDFLVEFQKDFQFDEFFLDRNAKDPFFSRQVALVDGGFKSITSIGNSNKYLVALNVSSDIPIPLPIETWTNLALIDGGSLASFAAEFGVSIVLFNKFIQFHFPMFTTANIKNNQQLKGITNFGQRISFSIDLNQLNKLKQ